MIVTVNTNYIFNNEIMSTNALSVKYKPTCNIRYGWCYENDELLDKSIKESMEYALKELDCSEASRWWIRVAIQNLYVDDTDFRDAIDNFEEREPFLSSLDLTDINKEVAEIYVEELISVRNDASMLKTISPFELFALLKKAEEMDEHFSPSIFPPGTLRLGLHLYRLQKLGYEVKTYKERGVFWQNLYREGVINPKWPVLINFGPAKWIGWAGENWLGQAISLKPEAFADGYVELSCLYAGWSCPTIVKKWSSGVRVVKKLRTSMLLEFDESLVKPSVLINGKMKQTSSCGKYIATIQMHGESSVYVYYRSKTDCQRYLVYTEDIDCGK